MTREDFSRRPQVSPRSQIQALNRYAESLERKGSIHETEGLALLSELDLRSRSPEVSQVLDRIAHLLLQEATRHRQIGARFHSLARQAAQPETIEQVATALVRASGTTRVDPSLASCHGVISHIMASNRGSAQKRRRKGRYREVMAELLQRRGRMQNAVAVQRKAVESLESPQLKGPAVARLADMLERTGRLEEASECYRRAASLATEAGDESLRRATVERQFALLLPHPKAGERGLVAFNTPHRCPSCGSPLRLKLREDAFYVCDDGCGFAVQAEEDLEPAPPRPCEICGQPAYLTKLKNKLRYRCIRRKLHPGRIHSRPQSDPSRDVGYVCRCDGGAVNSRHCICPGGPNDGREPFVARIQEPAAVVGGNARLVDCLQRGVVRAGPHSRCFHVPSCDTATRCPELPLRIALSAGLAPCINCWGSKLPRDPRIWLRALGSKVRVAGDAGRWLEELRGLRRRRPYELEDVA